MELIYKIDDHYFYHQKWTDRPGQYSYKHSVVLPKATYAPWLDDVEFSALYNIVKEHTLVDIYRCYELWSLVKQVKTLEGNILEVGVWRGGTGAILAKSSDSQVFLADTFAGVVKAGSKDNKYIGGEHSDTSRDSVENFLNTLGVSNYTILQGIFPEESSEIIKNNKFKFCHIDVDVYESAKDIFSWVFDRLVVGGIVVFDDYGFAACEGVTNLVNELALNSDLIMLHNLNGHAVIIKIK